MVYKLMLNNIKNKIIRDIKYYWSKTLKLVKSRGEFKMRKIDDSVYQGSIPFGENDVKYLEESGVKHVISIMEPWEWRYANGYYNLPDNFTHHFFSVSDCCSVDESFIDESLRLIDIINENYPDDKIYIHCYYGRGRSTVIIYAYLMKKYGLTYDEATTLLCEKIDNIYVNYHQIKSIKNFEKILNEDRKKESL
jgi:protein-tyrosine phosphatase